MPLNIYRASAGSGKTYTLAYNYIKMLLEEHSEQPHRHILGVTFTKKATAEMKGRILKELYLLSNGMDSNYRRDLCKDLGLSEDEVNTSARKCLNQILQDYSYFSINTIDSFFQQVVRAFAHELGWSSSYAIELDEESLEKRAIDDMLFNLTSNDKALLLRWMEEFMMHQAEDGMKWNPRDQISALASEVQRPEVRKILKDPNAIFHKKEELLEYIKELQEIVGKKQQQVRKLRQSLSKAIKDAGFQKKHFRGLAAFYWEPKEYNSEFPSQVRDAIEDSSKAAPKTSKFFDKETLLRMQEFAKTNLRPFFQQLPEVFKPDEIRDFKTALVILKNIYAIGILADIQKSIESLSHAENLMPISETNQLLLGVIEQNDIAPFVYEKLGQRLRHFMIDEFQDTNRIQWANLRPLLYESLSHETDYENMIVGDVKQSIYRWRQSDYRLLEREVEASFPNQSDYKPLGSNYRSSETVVRFNNWLFREQAQKVQQRFNDNFKDADEEQKTTLTNAYRDVRQEPTKTMAGHVVVHAFDSADFEEQALQVMVDAIRSALDRHIQPSQIAVLASTNKELSRLISRLISEGYKVSSNEGMLVGSHPAVAFVIKTMQHIYKGADRLTELEREYLFLSKKSLTPNTDFLPHADAGQHLLQQSPFSDAERLQQSVEEAFRKRQGQPTQLSALDEQAAEHIGLDLYSLVEYIIDLYGLREWQAAATYLTALQDMVLHFTETETATPAHFLEWWDERGSEKNIPVPEAKDSIQAMTIHKSKGLEFDLVLIPLCKWNIDKPIKPEKTIIWCEPDHAPFDKIPLVALPCSESSLKGTWFEKDLRAETLGYSMDFLNMTYVAFTRAARELFVCCPKKTKNAGNTGHIVLECLQKGAAESQQNMGDAEMPQHEDNPQHEGKSLHESVPADLRYHDDCYEVGRADFFFDDKRTKPKTDTDTITLGHTYPNSQERFKQRLSVETIGMSSDQTTESGKNIVKGTMLHDILSHVITESDAETYLQEQVRLGIMSEDELERGGYREDLERLFRLAQPYGWFEKDWDAVYCEHDIVLGDGQTIRPDRLMIRGNKAEIIDYKFGSAQPKSHLRQVREYKAALSEMGYSTQGWLVYVELGEIVEVR